VCSVKKGWFAACRAVVMGGGGYIFLGCGKLVIVSVHIVEDKHLAPLCILTI